ncbi:MAG: AMP-binding protein [Gammaproteobacteria bacterium]|nr:AMP-binding protein [Gammaproteobacteria bacterium]
MKQEAHTTGQIASAFNHAGIHREERVAVLVLDQIEFVQSFFGAFKAGVVPIALNTLLATPVYQDILLDSRAAAVIVSEELYDTLRLAIDASPFIRKVIVACDNTPQGCQSFDEFIGDAVPAEAIADLLADDKTYIYICGLRGMEQGVEQALSNILEGSGQSWSTLRETLREEGRYHVETF